MCETLKEKGNINSQITTTPRKVNSASPAKFASSRLFRRWCRKPAPPVTAPPPKQTSERERGGESAHTPTYRDIVSVPSRSRQAKSAHMRGVSSGQSGAGATVPTDLSQVYSTPGPRFVSEDKNVNTFTNVVNKKRKLKNMRGTSDKQCKIQVAESQCSIYVSRINKAVKVDDILGHISDMGEQCISIEQLAQRKVTSFNSYKITILYIYI